MIGLTSSTTDSAIQRVAEARILEAMEKGLFDNLPGEGKPLPEMDLLVPGTELIAWAREWIKREDLYDTRVRREK